MTMKNELKVKKTNNNQLLSLSKFSKNRENPFMEEALSDITTIKKRQIVNPNKQGEVQMIVNEQGEVTGHTAFMRFIEVDEEKFTKLYLSQFEAFWDLPSSAIRVFGYIMKQLKPKQDRFDFFLDECMMYTKYSSKPPIYQGLAALCENNIIARGYNEYVYFINPLIAFNGDRVTFTKTYVKKKKEADPNQIAIEFDNSQKLIQ